MRKLNVLIIEGDAVIRERAAALLRGRYGENAVTAAASLAGALAGGVGVSGGAQKGDESGLVDLLPLAGFDLVLTEWVLPDATGAVVVERLRDAGAQAIIVVTAANVGAAAAEAVLCGAADYVVRHADYLVTLPLVIEKNLAVARLRRERDAFERQLREQNETLEQLLRSLEEAAATDPLTGLFNRRHFATELERQFADALRGETDLACVMLDMDGFKQLNDTYGHQAGDAALVSASRTIRENLRRMDVAARYGGDEFVLLLPRSDVAMAAGVARRIRDAYAEEIRSRGFTSIKVGISIGVATMEGDHPETADALVAAADAALYRAKRNGRDRVYVSTAAEEAGAALLAS